MTFGQKLFKPTPPDKGSFPLDHEGLCKESMKKFMQCLSKENNNSSACREETREYLDCRMRNNLMAREEWSKLGFSEEPSTVEKQE